MVGHDSGYGAQGAERGRKMSEKEYKLGEVFKHTDGNVYRCVEGETCAFRLAGKDCYSPYCDSSGRSDGLNVNYIPVTEPVDGMLFCTEDGSMYRLTKGDHFSNFCVGETDAPFSCTDLDQAVFGHNLSHAWYWAPVEEEGATDESAKLADFCHQTNYDRIIKSLESLAKEMVFETMKGVYRYRIGEKVSTKSFRTKEEAVQDAVEYLEQETENA